MCHRYKTLPSKTFSSHLKRLLVFAWLGFSLNASATAQTNRSAISSPYLKDALPFPIGAAINNSHLKNITEYRDIVQNEYNSLTPETVMKFAHIHPEPKKYQWNGADDLVQYGLRYKKRIHGHTLVWHKNLPDWVNSFQGTPQEWDKLLKDHIITVVTRYRGKVTSWDVVNEAFEDDGSLRDSIWLKNLGPEYIEKSFIYANHADPRALLFYNDYGHEYSSRKRNAINDMIGKLLQKGIPIHGIGLQMHTNCNRPNEDFFSAIQTAASIGLKVHIAELDIAMNPKGDPNLTFTEELAQLQKSKYEFIVKTFHALPASQKYGITMWNVTDADTWITSEYKRADWPLPFDANYQRKPAYEGIVNAVK